MKIIKHSKLMLMLSAVMFLSSCTDKSSLLVKTWMVDNLKYSQKVSPELQPQIDRSIEELRKSFRLTYKADGSYTTQNNDQLLSGKWKLNWNSTAITSISDRGEQKEFKVVELSDSKFTFKAVEGGEEVTFEMIPAK